ncbi:MAG TPA: UDP-N-acetylglucosamine 1-carboxyvinyltransferase [Candidatus Saccharimonadales bacterium]|nr:UDP-N-acetylglucosamine 1-carboxyvinyltransferase [Candidatus Saccharimonadales bacterium]
MEVRKKAVADTSSAEVISVRGYVDLKSLSEADGQMLKVSARLTRSLNLFCFCIYITYDIIDGMNEVDYKQKIGKLIQRIRSDRNMTQIELARALGTSQSAVNRIENGGQNLSMEMLARISDALQSEIVSLSTGSLNFRVEGGHKLSGEVTINTSKNAAVSLLCASLLNKGTTTLRRMPRIEEVNRLLEVMVSIGVKVRWLNDFDLEIKPPKTLQLDKMNEEAGRRTRSVVMFMGPLMHLVDEFMLPYAGGCKLGERTIQPHLFALEEFGLNVLTTQGWYRCTVEHKKPSKVVMYEEGDTPTENALMAAARTPGVTEIRRASSNYMVQDTCFFLEKLGVKIEGIGTSTLRVHGIKNINLDVEYWPSEDPIEAMTFLSVAATTNSPIAIKRAPIDFLDLELLKLEKMGFKFELGETYKAKNGQTNLIDIFCKESGELVSLEDKIEAHPFPGINIDNLPFFVPIAATARGKTLIHDWVYENRAIYYTELSKLNADVSLADVHRAYVNGPTRWKPAEVICPPALRPAVVLLIGMLAAPGVSVLRNIYSINRGYEDLAERLKSLGAKIEIIREI